jgi:hypothetical protein
MLKLIANYKPFFLIVIIFFENTKSAGLASLRLKVTGVHRVQHNDFLIFWFGYTRLFEIAVQFNLVKVKLYSNVRLKLIKN